MENWVEWLRQAAPGTELRIQEPMSRHTTFQVGGPAAVWAEPGSAEELAELAALCRREKNPLFRCRAGKQPFSGGQRVSGSSSSPRGAAFTLLC